MARDRGHAVVPHGDRDRPGAGRARRAEQDAEIRDVRLRPPERHVRLEFAGAPAALDEAQVQFARFAIASHRRAQPGAVRRRARPPRRFRLPCPRDRDIVNELRAGIFHLHLTGDGALQYLRRAAARA
ncbi:MAG: hypothetical protein WDM96_04595 [Lacunisphaera sp.]